jgi:hypothetical protein
VLIQITKRADGALHDLTHYAVETTLGAKRGLSVSWPISAVKEFHESFERCPRQSYAA